MRGGSGSFSAAAARSSAGGGGGGGGASTPVAAESAATYTSRTTTQHVAALFTLVRAGVSLKAKDSNVFSHHVCPRKMILEICNRVPTTLAELKAIGGFGHKRATDHHTWMLPIVTSYIATHSLALKGTFAASDARPGVSPAAGHTSTYFEPDSGAAGSAKAKTKAKAKKKRKATAAKKGRATKTAKKAKKAKKAPRGGAPVEAKIIDITNSQTTTTLDESRDGDVFESSPYSFLGGSDDDDEDDSLLITRRVVSGGGAGGLASFAFKG